MIQNTRLHNIMAERKVIQDKLLRQKLVFGNKEQLSMIKQIEDLDNRRAAVLGDEEKLNSGELHKYCVTRTTTEECEVIAENKDEAKEIAFDDNDWDFEDSDMDVSEIS